MSFTITSALRWWARETPNRISFDIDGVEISWSDLDSWTQSVAAELSRRNIGPGDRVAVIAGQSLPYLALAIGAQLVGAIIVPVNTRYTKRDLEVVIADTTPKLLLADSERFPLAAQVSAAGTGFDLIDVGAVENWKDQQGQKIDYQPERFQTIALMSTSGTTARPKFVVFNHDMVVSIALELQLIEPRIRHSNVMIPSPFFSGGLYVNFEYMVLGCTVYIRTKLDGESLLDVLEDKRINVMATSNIFWERVAAAPRFKDADLSSLFWAVIGGARVSGALVNTYRQKGVLLRCLYGLTESGGSWAATGKALDGVLNAGYGGPFTEWRAMREGKQCAAGEIGEITIKGPSVTPGYWNNPEATSGLLRDGWIHTGDLGFLDDSGVLTFVDRMKDIIKSGGLTISASEVEHVVSEVSGVDEVVVIPVDDPNFGETPMAVIYAREPVEVEAVMAHCRTNLSGYKLPRYVVVETEPLPRLNTGKISKMALKEKYREAARRLKPAR